jgi:hypothetical protein
MGLILEASCDACDFHTDDLRLGADNAQMSAHDRSSQELYRTECCAGVQSVEVFLGFPPPEVPCARCGGPLRLTDETRYRVATLKGEAYAEHPCPACGAKQLGFRPTGKFI